VRGEGGRDRELLVVGPPPVDRVAEGHDPDDLAVGVLEWDEQLVVGVPALGPGDRRLSGRDEALADVL